MLQRRSDENSFEHMLRLVRGKKSGDIQNSWEEIANILNNGMSWEYLRKVAHGLIM